MVDDDDIGDLSSPQQENEEHDCERLVEFLHIKKISDQDQAPSYIDLSFLFIFRRASFPISHCNALWKYFFPIRLGVQCQDKFLGLAQKNDGKKVNTNSVQN